MSETNLFGPVWRVADRLRGDDKAAGHGRMIPPVAELRRLDCVLARWSAR